LNRAVRAEPICNVPVGEGAKRVTTGVLDMMFIFRKGKGCMLYLRRIYRENKCGIGLGFGQQ
jgi:hypothetical protein